MAKTIKASDILEGDRIKVTLPTDSGRTVTYEGVASNFTTPRSGPRWRTAEGACLWTDEDFTVIELLDRPKPKITVPTLPNAVVKYTFADWAPEPRFAVRDAWGKWTCYDAEGGQRNQRPSDEEFQTLLLEDSPEFEVLFAGVAK